MTAPAGSFQSIRGDIADLLLGRTCAGCQQGSNILCSPCWSALLSDGPFAPQLPGLDVVTAWSYQGAGRGVLLAFKERGVRDLVDPLGIALARCLTVISDHPIIVVPMPPHRRSVTDRGFDVVEVIAERACHALTVAGQPARRISLLERHEHSSRQVGRGRQDRLNVAAAEFRLRAHADLTPDQTLGTVILVDDVVTTGATLRAATLCLSETGLGPAAQATIAAA